MNATCFYSQIKLCDQYPAFQTAGLVVMVFDWVTVGLGVVACARTYAARKKETLGLVPHEVFLICFTSSILSIAVGITLSVTIGIRTLLLHTFHALGDSLAFIGACVLLNMCLKVNGTNDPFINRLRKWALPLMALPASMLLVCYMGQGYYSDVIEFQENGSDYQPMFNVILILVGIMFIFTLTYLIVILFIGRRNFQKALVAVKKKAMDSSPARSKTPNNPSLPAARNPHSVQFQYGSAAELNGWTDGSNIPYSSNGWSYGTDSRAYASSSDSNTIDLSPRINMEEYQKMQTLKLALQNGISVMGSMALGCLCIASYTAVYLYTVFSGHAQSTVVYVLTLIAVFSVLVIIAFVVFVIQIVNSIRKMRSSIVI